MGWGLGHEALLPRVEENAITYLKFPNQIKHIILENYVVLKMIKNQLHITTMNCPRSGGGE